MAQSRFSFFGLGEGLPSSARMQGSNAVGLPDNA
jgi:hypothetical protein